MATVEELRERVAGLRQKLSGMESFNVSTTTSKQNVMRPGGRWGLGPMATATGQFINVPTTSVAKNPEYDKTLNELLSAQTELQDSIYSREGTFNTLADQIRGLTGGGRMTQGAAFNAAVQGLGAGRNYGSSDLGTRLNFQVSDQQIIDDFNQAKLGRLNRIVTDGNAQIAGIGERINTANTLLNSLPASDPRRTSSEAFIKELQADLRSVQDAVANAQGQITDFKPATIDSEDGLREITSFREFVKLPEERAGDQLRQIDPDSYQAAVNLGQRYRQMATEALPDTTDPRTEQLRGALEDLAFQELQLGGRLSPEETRAVQQAVRGRQAQLGNVEGMGPFSEEFAALGLASDNRRLARAQNALSLLSSGQSRSDAARENLALRDTLLQNRLGRAADFVASGPSVYNLANTRTGQQQAAFQNYVNANQANPGQFNPTTIQNPFYQTTNPQIPVALTQTAANIYGSLADYQARTYGAQVGAQAQVASANSVPNYISAFSNLVPSFSF